MPTAKIQSLKQLKAWNQDPTKELPDAYSWFFDYFFGLLDAGQIDTAKDAHESHIKFCMICTGFSRNQAEERVNGNIGYYSGYSARWGDLLRRHFPQASHPLI